MTELILAPDCMLSGVRDISCCTNLFAGYGILGEGREMGVWTPVKEPR